MSASLNRLFYLLTLLTREHGLSSLSPDERKVFDFLVEKANTGEQVTMSLLLAKRLLPRASAYRHVAALISKGFIEENIVEGERLLSVAQRFDEFENALGKLVRADS